MQPRLKRWESFVWKRPCEVYGEGNFTLWDTIEPNDISQGDCGDCYFLSSLSSLAETPDRIKKIFTTKALNKAGCYAIELYLTGRKTTVVVDDKFPYCPQRKRFAMCRTSKSNEIWVMLLEKAWAKVFGSYQRIESGTAGEVMKPLTGCPTKFFIHDEVNMNKLWKTLLKADKEGMPMACAVASSQE